MDPTQNRSLAERKRDKLLLRLLKTPPQPRPKRDREKATGEKPANAGKREPSA
jgi:hypothetical protein